MRFTGTALVLVLGLVGCGSASSSTTASPSSTSMPTSTAASAVGQVIEAFDLYTHCGVRETRIGARYYEATPVLDDGHGNPPSGWGNPQQLGTMTVLDDGTAHFSAPGGLEADFLLRPGATDWMMICS